jgi:hypothetical protein
MKVGLVIFGSEIIQKTLTFPIIAYSAGNPGVHYQSSQGVEYEIILLSPFVNGRKSI